MQDPTTVGQMTLRAQNPHIHAPKTCSRQSAGEHLSPEYTANVSMYQSVPVLDVEGTKICESGAILTYLAEKSGSPLLPSDPFLRAKVMEALLLHDNSSLCLAREVTHQVIRPTFYAFMGKKSLGDLRAAVGQGILTLHSSLGLIEEILSHHAFIAGAQLTIADFLVVCELNQLTCVGPLMGNTDESDSDVLAMYPHISAYLAKVSELVPNADLHLNPFRNFVGIILKAYDQ